MKRVLSEFTGLPVDHIALTELWQFHFHRVLEDRDPVSNISSRDIIAGYVFSLNTVCSYSSNKYGLIIVMRC